MKNRQYPLMFHDVYQLDPFESGFQKASSNSFKISQANFLQLLDNITKIIYLQKGTTSDVIFTFDDGGQSFVWIAKELYGRGLVGHFFISTKYIGAKGFCTEDQIREIDEMGHIIGCHSHSHPSRISSLNEDDLRAEWTTSTCILERILGKPVVEASIPGGYYSLSSVRILCDLGYKTVYTSRPSLAVKSFKSLVILGRFTIRNINPIDQYTSYVKKYSLLRKKMYLRWYILEIAKKLTGPFFFRLRNSLKRF